MTKAVIVSAARTPVSSFMGSFANTPAHDLGAAVLAEVVARAGIDPAEVDETILGQVLTAGQGQNPARQAHVKAGLPQDVCCDTVMRVATIDRTPPEVVREVERVLERKMASVFSQGFTFAGGVKEVADILNRVDRSTEKAIMADLEEKDPELADEIARLMFTFDDLVNVDDTGIQKAMREIEQKDLALALKSASEDITAKIMRNVSERAREMIKEEMEFMGPVRLRMVEEAQQKIVSVIRRLEEAGEVIVASRGGEDEVIV